MILINIKDLVSILPDLINLFLSGFIFMRTYGWFNNKKTDISILTTWSIFISVLIEAFYSSLHFFILPSTKIPDAIKIIIFSVTGFLLAVLFTLLRNTKLFRKILYKINNKSIHDDIFDAVIDSDKGTMMMIYLKSSDVYYIGRFCFREEKGAESWIALIKYCSFNKETNQPIINAEKNDLRSSVVINLKDVERIEIVYEEDSAAWKILSDKM